MSTTENSSAPNETAEQPANLSSEAAPDHGSVALHDASTPSADDGDDGDHDDASEDAAEGEAPGEAAAGDAAGPAKKRRRRRRKKRGANATPGGLAEAGGEPSADAASAGDAAAADKDKKVLREFTPPKQGGKPKDPKQNNKKRDGAKHGGSKEPRERPAFGLGDVVFGKVIEITDEALFVDLSGKGRGIFDRLELDIPDEPAQGPDAPAIDEEEEEPKVSATPEIAADAAPAVEASAPTEEAAAAEASNAEAARVSATRPRARIVEPRGLAKDAASADAATATDAATADVGGEDAAPEAAAEAANAEAPAKREPAPVAVLPPVVLELGANFVAVVANDGARGGLIVLTRHPRRASKAKPRVLAAFKEKTEVMGLVTGVIKGGVEVDVDGIRAFAPRSHMDLRLGADLHNLVGKRLSFEVTQYGKKGRDVVLSRRAKLEAEAKGKREEALTKLPIGTIVEGTVKTVVTFGAFIDIGHVEGLVPLSEMSHNRSDKPSDVFKVGQKTQVKIVKVDEKGKIWLSHKAALPDPWGDLAAKYAVGTKHTGKVVRIQPFGAFVELETGIDGLIHAGDLSFKRVEDPNEVVKVGDSLEVVVATLDTSSHKISLHPIPQGANANETHQRVQLHKPVKVAVVAIDPGGLIVRILGATGRNARGFITSAATGTPRGTELRKLFPIGKELEAKVIELDAKRGEVKLSIKALGEDNERSSYKQYQAQVKAEAKFGTFGDLLAKKLQK